MNKQDALVEYLLRLGDSALILGQRLSERVGHSPALEEEMGTANVALDLVGQARGWLGYAAELEGNGRDEDTLAFHRDAWDFRNLLIVEMPNDHYGFTIARQYLFDAYHLQLLRALTASEDARIAELAAKAVKEVGYHVRRSAQWVVRLGDGTEESHAKIQAAIDELWCYTGEMFKPDSVDRLLLSEKIAPDLAVLRLGWNEHVAATLDEATLNRPSDGWMQSGGKQGTHTEHLGYVLAEMQFLPRAYPDARW